MRIRQVMTSPVICAEVPGNRTDVLHLMIRHHTSGVPVVREGTMDWSHWLTLGGS